MVARNYEAQSFQQQDRRQVAQPQLLNAGAKPAGTVTGGGDEWKSKLVGDIANVAGRVLGKLEDQHYESRYLEGMAKAGQIESEEQIEGNPISRDWEVAGYRDTMGKLLMADQDARRAVDMKMLREQPPAKMQEYLAKQRAEIAPQLASMSREQRSTAFGQLLLGERAATKKHAAEHQAFIIDKRLQSINTIAHTSIQTLSSVRDAASLGDLQPDVYAAQIEKTAGDIFGSVWADSTLPDDVKQAATDKLLQQVLLSENVDLYDYLDSTGLPDGKGGTPPLTLRIPHDSRVALSKLYRETMDRTEDRRSMARHRQIGTLESELDSGAFSGTSEQLSRFGNEMLLNKVVSASQVQGWHKKYNDMQHNREVDGELFRAGMSGDLNAVQSMGKGVDDVVKATERTLTREKADSAKRLDTWLNMGQRMGTGWQKAGELVGVAMAQMQSPDAKMLPQHIETFKRLDATFKAEEKAGRANSRAMLMAGIPEEYRLRFERITALVGSGASADEALTRVLEREGNESKVTPSVRAAMAQKTSQDVGTAIDGIGARGLLASIGLHVSGLWNSVDAARLSIAPESRVGSRDGWLSDGPTVQFYEQRMRDHLREEASHVMLQGTGDTADQVVNVAASNLAARTIKTSSGPLFVPRGTDFEAVFGVGKANQAAIGPAIDKMLQPTKADTRWQLSFAQGRPFAQEVDKNGARVGTGFFIQREAILPAIAEIDAERQSARDAVHGSGKRVIQGGAEIAYNGVNTAAAKESWMLEFRDALVKNEGVRNHVYDDATGKPLKEGETPQGTATLGVGLTKDYMPKPDLPDGKYSNAALTKAFLKASDDAARAGTQAMKKTGLTNKHWFMLFSELGYQSGTSFLDQQNNTGAKYREFVRIAGTGDGAATEASFKETAAWYYSRDKSKPNTVARRQGHYMDLLRKAMKG